MKTSITLLGALLGTPGVIACATLSDENPPRYEPLSRFELEADAGDPPESLAEGALEPENEEVIFEVMRASKDDIDTDSEPGSEDPLALPLDSELKVDPNKPLLVPSQEGIIVTRF